MTTASLWRGFPTHVRLPDGTVHRNAYVLLAEGDRAGLHCWLSRPGEDPDLTFPVDLGSVRVPRTDREAKNGWTVPLADGGQVVLTKSSGCGCGTPLRRFGGPSWAATIRV